MTGLGADPEQIVSRSVAAGEMVRRRLTGGLYYDSTLSLPYQVGAAHAPIDPSPCLLYTSPSQPDVEE